MSNFMKIMFCAFGLVLFAGSAGAADPAPLSRDEMKSIRGEDYIDYGVLRRNSIPCSKRGSSGANCDAGAQANPYTRGCSAINRCRR